MDGRLAVVLVLLLLSGCITVDIGEQTQRSADDGVTVTVVEVVDGDTLDVRYQNGTRDTVRLIGVDTPEVHVENSPREFGYENTSESRSWLRDWGHRASEFARTELRGEEVRLTFDSNTDRRGGYDRLLAYVHHDGTLFNEQLLTRGYARVYESDFTRRDSFDDAAATARADGVGLWEYGDESNASALVRPLGERSVAVSETEIAVAKPTTA